jgi:hypothetical protein
LSSSRTTQLLSPSSHPFNRVNIFLSTFFYAQLHFDFPPAFPICV